MQREFSKELPEDREFEIGGQIFRWIHPHWREGAEFFDAELEQIRESAKEQQESGNGVPLFSWVAEAEKAVKGVPFFLDPDYNDAHQRWADLMARKKDPVPRYQIEECYRWLVEVTGGFPTLQPEISTSGAGTSDTPSGEGAS